MGSEGKKAESKKVVVLKAIKSVKKPKEDQYERKARVLVSADNKLDMPVVYVYGPLELYKEIRSKLYKDEGADLKDAKGYCSFGRLVVGEEGACVAVVWANWRYTPEQAMPIIVHELCHAADDILAHAGVKDENGEAKAYFVESEYVYVLKKLYGVKFPRTPTELVKEALNDVQLEG